MEGYAFAMFCLCGLLYLRTELTIRWVRKAVKINGRRLENIWRANPFDPQLDFWAVKLSYKKIVGKYWDLTLNLTIWTYEKAFPELPTS
jgi:hypothetical protein